MIEFHGQPNAAGMRRVLQMINRSRGWRYILSRLIVLLAVAGLVFDVYQILNEGSQSPRIWRARLIILLFLIWFVRLYWVRLQLANQAAKSPPLKGYIDFQGITLKTPAGEASTAWQDFARLVEGDDLMGLLTDAGTLFVLRRDFFANESQWQAALNLARTRVVPPK